MIQEGKLKEYLQDSSAVLEAVGSDGERGLTAGEAAARLERDGLNKLKEAEKDPLWKRFLAQMADPMIIMLIVAAVISALTGIAQGEADFADVIIICFVVVVNAVLGVVQESKAEEALAALQEMSAAQSKAVRDGRIVAVPSSELVVGDVVVLEAGTSRSATARTCATWARPWCTAAGGPSWSPPAWARRWARSPTRCPARPTRRPRSRRSSTSSRRSSRSSAS